MSAEIVKQKSRGFICVNAHPGGCRENVARQAGMVRGGRTAGISGAKNVVVVGASTGYGLASRISAAWGFGAKTLGICLERAPERGRTATAGYYNTAAFHELAKADGLFAASLNADAFSDEAKRSAAEMVRREMGKADLVIYSVAAPKRTDARTGQTYSSVLKPIGQPYSSRTIDLDSARVTDVTIQPATEQEIADTVAVMGGEDWQAWMEMLLAENLLAEGARTLSYSYIGPELTWPVYRDGTIGQAKKDLEKTARELSAMLQARLGGSAWVAVNKAIVTQASAAIPVVPLYISILRKVMTEKRLEEGAIEQMRRLFFDYLADGRKAAVDADGRIRMDDREMRADVQSGVKEVWPGVTTENLFAETDYAGFQKEFRNLFGFEVDGVDYSQPMEIDVTWS
jgi:enoyl-[acyl-carrier protein] reductase / trans-2-enoyl-CoA reductase (NAD+)